VARAEGDVARFEEILDQYHRAPQITRERLYFDTVSAVLSHSSKILIDIDKSSPVLNLPLAELLRAGSAGETSATSPAGNEDTAVQPPLRAADPSATPSGTLRSRDRGSY
jgi:membrane protease subunit HflK